MKNPKLLVLTVLTTFAMVGCSSGGNNSTLPSGGKDVDLSEDEGKAALKAKLEGAAGAYLTSEINALELNSNLSGANAGLSVSTNLLGADISAGLNLSNFALTSTTKALLHEDDAELHFDIAENVKTTNGKLAVNATLPTLDGKTTKFSSDLSLKGLEVNAYVVEDKAYVDFSNEENRALVTGAETFVNGLLDGVSKSIYGDFLPLITGSEMAAMFFDEEGKFAIANLYDELDKKLAFDLKDALIVDLPFDLVEEAEEDDPTADVDDEDPTGDEDEEEYNIFDGIVETLSYVSSLDVGFQFKTYSDGGFAFGLSLNKEKIKKLVNTIDEDFDATQIDKYLNKFNFDAGVHFGKDFLLDSVKVSYTIDAKLDELPLFGSEEETYPTYYDEPEDVDDEEPTTYFNAKLTASAKYDLGIKYNTFTTLDLPDFSDFVPFALDL